MSGFMVVSCGFNGGVDWTQSKPPMPRCGMIVAKACAMLIEDAWNHAYMHTCIHQGSLNNPNPNWTKTNQESSERHEFSGLLASC